TVWVKQVVRQQEPGYRRAVEQLQEGKFREAVASLREQGRVVEIVDEGDRIFTLAERYVAQPEGNLAVGTGNRERGMANAGIHGMLPSKGPGGEAGSSYRDPCKSRHDGGRQAMGRPLSRG